jgi:endonuclease/exonuclease/phosphatase family metal-dependent hydrolase
MNPHPSFRRHHSSRSGIVAAIGRLGIVILAAGASIGWQLNVAGATEGDSESIRPVARADVKLVTYNIRYLNRGDGPDHWDHRVDAVAEVVRGGDVVGLQEATRQQIDDLIARLPEFDWYGVGRDDGKDQGEFTPVFWRKTRFEASDRGTFWLGPDPSAIGQPAWDAKIPRICSWVVLSPAADQSDDDSPKRSRPLVVFNTHFDHQSDLARLNSAKLIRKKLGQIAGDNEPILMGDFNCRPDSEPIAELTQAQTLLSPGDRDRTERVLSDTIGRSETPAEGPSGTWNGFRQIDPETRIDYIFTGEHSPRILTHQTLDPKTSAGRFASDHLPVVVTIRL